MNLYFFIVSVTLSLFATSSHAFTLQGTKSNIKGWNTKALEFRLNPADCPSDVDALLDDAMEVWNNVPTSALTVKRGSDTSVSLAEAAAGSGAGMPAIFCSTNMAAEANLDPSVIPGVAIGMHTGSGGHVDYGYIVLNAQPGAAANIETLDSDLVKVVLAHEMGHVIGLGHSASKEALMYYNASEKEQLALAQDDMDGVTYLYPRDELQGDKLFGACGVISGPAPVMRLMSLLLLLWPLGLLFKPFKRFGL